MAQEFTDNIPGSSNQWEDDLDDIKDNFTALKSTFSGATAPSNPVAGMFWADTTNNILKIRDKNNNTWYSIFDLANNKPILSALSGDITGAMIAASIKDAAAGTASLRTLGTTGTTACAGNDSRLSDTRTPSDSSVSQAKLKTSSGSVSINTGGGVFHGLLTLPGGAYGFYPQISIIDQLNRLTLTTAQIFYRAAAGNYSATSTINLYAEGNSTGGDSITATQRYVTSSGEIFWIFQLRDKITKHIIATYAAPDHPCFGNGSKPLVAPHPFGHYDPLKHEIVVINPTETEIKELERRMIVNDETKPDLSLIEVVNKLYEIDEKAGSPPWPSVPVTVGLPTGHDWKRVQEGAKVIPVRKKIPKMEYFLTRTLRLK